MKQFINCSSISLLIFIIIEQLVVAISTLSIIRFSNDIVNSQQFFGFWLFVFSLIVVFIPRMFKQKAMTNAMYTTFKSYILIYEKNLYNHPYLQSNHEFCKQRQAFFHNQTWQTIERAYVFFEDLSTIIINVIFNIIVLGMWLTPWFFLAYFFSFFIILISIKVSKKLIVKKTTIAQISQSNMQNFLFDGWDTLLIGNNYNWNKWKTNFFLVAKKSQDAEIDYKVVSNFLSLLTMTGSIIPIIIVIFSAFLNNINNIAYLTAIIATLPRQISNIQNLSVIIEYLMDFSSIKERIKNIRFAASVPKNIEQLQGKIQWNKIYFTIEGNKKQFINLWQCFEYLENINIGRILITGSNGSGKTTILGLIKEYFGDNVYLFSNYAHIFFEKNELQEYSTGEKIKSNIQELLEHIDETSVHIILFDEWNANLDTKNQIEISKYIDKLAEKNLVLEVRNKEMTIK